MKISKNRTLTIAIAIFFALSMTASMMLTPSANAHTPAWNIPTYSFISVSPNPIGVGQTARVNFWVNMPPPTASAQYGDRWIGLTVKVTLPDGTSTTLGPFTSDATGGTSTTYTPATAGNYTFVMTFPGQTLAGKNLPPGDTNATFASIGDYFEPSTSTGFMLTVQQAAVASAPVTPLPTTYWSRPINAMNNNWYSIGGNWLGLSQSTFAATGQYNATGDYNPWTTAPTTAHILWTKPEAFGGTIGGEFGGSEESNFYATSQYEPKFAPIIMDGVLYYTMYPGSSTNPVGWTAVNLQTGQTLWTDYNNTEVLRCGQILDMITPNQYGALAYLWTEPVAAAGFMSSGISMSMWDAMTGAYILTITNTPAMTLTEDSHGDLIGYYMNDSYAYVTTPYGPIPVAVTGASITEWNSTKCINLSVGNYAGGPPVADDWMWRPPQNGLIPFAQGLEWSAPLPLTDSKGNPLTYEMSMFGMTFPAYLLGISAIQSGYILLTGYNSGSSGMFFTSGWQEEAGFSLSTLSLAWGPTNRTEVPYSIVYTGGVWAGSGAYVELTESTLSITAFSLATGDVLWGPTSLPGARAFDTLGANALVANGVIYIWLYGGDVYAYNILTGALVWQYHTPSGGFESPYGYESLWTFTVGTIAGGELFLPEGHMYSPPLFHGAQQLALNITNGDLVWSIDAFDVTSAPAVSDGIATTLNAYDVQIYAYGMGPSKTTVSAPNVGVTTDTPITITGSVMDISAGSQQQAVAANFPNGLPCVSDASMSQFMEAVYEQQPMPTNVTGVPVTLSVTDSNHNSYNIGTTTTNAMGEYGLTWTPIVPGNYTLYATFEGTNSYYGSSASTFFYAGSPPATASPYPTPVSGLASVGSLELGIAAVIIVIVIIGALLAVLVLRKRP
ncbi:MAG TPA: hypothetical protein VK536_02970 [Candidatus Limnocylindrales bacterium]|nr:hypothetical protein [Candidatus Limnocylindrales bacterium]